MSRTGDEGCQCALNVRRIWALDEETSIEIPSLAVTSSDIVNVCYSVLSNSGVRQGLKTLDLRLMPSKSSDRESLGTLDHLWRSMSFLGGFEKT